MIILDIDMPENCRECPLTAYSDMFVEDYCAVNGNYDENKRPDDCPIVARVVTCKDCKWGELRIEYGDYECHYTGFGDVYSADDYCSYGERREEKE